MADCTAVREKGSRLRWWKVKSRSERTRKGSVAEGKDEIAEGGAANEEKRGGKGVEERRGEE